MSSTIRHLAFAAATAVPTFAGLAAAAAQAPVGAPAPLPARVGWEGGVGLYAGDIDCNDQVHGACGSFNDAGGIAGHLTYMFRPGIGMTLDVWPMVHHEDNFTFTHTVATLGVTLRPVPILALGVGLGNAHATAHWDGFVDVDARSADAPAVLFSAGLDVVRGRTFAVAVEARAGIGFYGDDKDDDGNPDIVGRNLGVGAAITWF
ncbi:MAG TPA: hypothetical protein VHE35_03280 [Kofleriaceae bacterium]|nr:hypothetical protein [Kofleriaceae bacterium]